MEPIFTLETYSAILVKELLEAGYILSSDTKTEIVIYGKTAPTLKDNFLNELMVNSVTDSNTGSSFKFPHATF